MINAIPETGKEYSFLLRSEAPQCCYKFFNSSKTFEDYWKLVEDVIGTNKDHGYKVFEEMLWKDLEYGFEDMDHITNKHIFEAK